MKENRNRNVKMMRKQSVKYNEYRFLYKHYISEQEHAKCHCSLYGMV